MLKAVGEEQSPAGQVQKTDRPEKGTEAGALSRIEGAPDQSPG